MTSLLERLKPTNKGTAKLTALDPDKLDKLPSSKESLGEKTFQGIEALGFRAQISNERYRVVLETRENSQYQLDIYDSQKIMDPTLPGASSRIPNLLARQTYQDRVKAMKKFTDAEAYYLRPSN